MRRRIVTLYVVLALIVSSLVAFVIYGYSSRMYIKELTLGLQHEALLSALIISGQANGDPGSINDTALDALADRLISKDQNEMGEEGARRITLIDEKGYVIADSDANSNRMANHLERPEVRDALETGTGVDIRKSATTGQSFLYYAHYEPELKAIIRIAASVASINEIRNTILFYSVLVVAAGMVLSGLMALRLSDYVIKPVARLVKQYGSAGAVTRIREGFRRDDEIGQLSQTLSSMTRRIENTILELQDRNARVDTIINSMGNGLVAVDRNMQVILVNPVAKRLFGVSEQAEVIGKPLVQVVRNRLINDLLYKAIRSNQIWQDEITIYQGGKRTLSLYVSPIYPVDRTQQSGGALVFINDVTSIRKLEEMRSEFVSNVTHELKTPLTSIRGFVETLKTGAVKDPVVAEKFLDIIDIEADRLSTLINDILQLSEIEGMKQDLELNRFPLRPLVEDVESMLSGKAGEKEVGFEIQVSEDFTIQANSYRIKQLLINLMDNGVKYNKKGGKVTVKAEKKEAGVQIRVKDTGIGIPADHTARIFERFYRVDKSRSREMGGTGLGLSIVKHIAQLYGGSVRVESEEGKGSEFIVFLPD